MLRRLARGALSWRVALVRDCITQRSLSTTLLTRHVTKLLQTPDDNLLHVTWSDGTSDRYPFVYLRDICKCPECFHESSLQRSFDSVAGLDPGLVASHVDLQLSGKRISLTWPNSHVTTFDSDWLYERRLPELDAEQKGSNLLHDDAQLWDQQLTGHVPTLQYNDVVSSDASCLGWLDLISSHGIVLIKGAPTAGHVKALGDALGFLKASWFGESYRIENNVDGSKTSRVPLSSVPQAPCPYNEYRGGLQLIHCQKEVIGPGGEHTFVDGFNITKHLKDNEPEAFELLCTSPIMYHRKAANQDADLDMRFARPVISLEPNGSLKRVIYNDSFRATFVNATPDEIPKLYRSYYKVSGLVRDPKYIVRNKLQPGDIMTYDCDRVLCGREPFGPEVKGPEVFELGFTDKDMTNSRRRTLGKS